MSTPDWMDCSMKSYHVFDLDGEKPESIDFEPRDEYPRCDECMCKPCECRKF